MSDMAGTFLLTFDCEGKWGVVDRPAYRYASHTTPNLEATYRRIVGMLQAFGIGATFAFTGAFTMSAAEFARLRPQIDGCAAGSTPWLRGAAMVIDRDGGDGWFSPACFGAAKDAGVHEIASHGFSHMPWGAAWATRDVLDAELALSRQVAGFGDSVESFVYPRNQIAQTDLLPLHGFNIYRAARPSLGRPVNLMRELNLFEASERLGPLDRLPVAIPAGYFLNWRLGLRRCIPVAWTVSRWEHMLRHAALTGGVVHAWTHPENFIDGYAMFRLLGKILRLVADEREAGRLRIVSCRDLVRLSPSSQRLLRPVSEPRAIIGA
jgi:peptidoglycan/xylan/chitin deacetylase (PgdA/CDA1 family)